MKKIIGIACKDAGASNLIFGWIKNNKKNYYKILLKKPASSIVNNFSLNKKKIKIFKNRKNFFKDLDFLITGSGSSLFEKKIISYAIKKKIYVATVLDHYLNFKSRLIFNNQFILPNEIWCFDLKTYLIAKKIIKNIDIKLKKNFFLNDYLKKSKPVKLIKNPQILYLTEPFAKFGLKKCSYEIQSLKFFFDNFHRLNIKRNIKIIIRLHPKEKKSKYICIVKKYQKILNIDFDNNNSLLKTINSSSVVFGLSSYALVVALKLRRKVFHCKLPGQKFQLLPYKSIQSFYEALK
jgi:hypothetical protein